MRTASNRALARALGVSETAVRKAEKAGRIRRAGDGSWEVDRVKAAWGANTDAEQRTPAPGLRPVPEAAVGAVRETLRDHGESVPAAGGMTFLQARTANEVLKAQERKLRLGPTCTSADGWKRRSGGKSDSLYYSISLFNNRLTLCRYSR